jgi:anti-anti-sigma factor
MSECTVVKENSHPCIVPGGRIDALTAPDIQKVFDERVLEGDRIFLVDMARVNYVSSAGLRIFLKTQKELKKVGGEIILFSLAPPVLEVFRVSGFDRLFRMAAGRENLPDLLRGDRDEGEIRTLAKGGLSLRYLERRERPGTLFTVGSQDGMEGASYSERDVVPVKAADMPFGCGLAALGDRYDEYRDLFGESMVVGNCFFFYPAVRHSSVDYLIEGHRDSGLTYKFFHGFGYSGGYRYLLSFQGTEGPVDLSSLVRSFFDVSGANVLGISLAGESRGAWGMHLKRVPVTEQKPANGKAIFDGENFSQWFDFPVEPSFVNHIVVATGVAVRERAFLRGGKASLLSGDNDFHLHGGIFDKGPLGSNPAEFDGELMRIFREHRIFRIQHLLGRSLFSGGMAAIVELEE